MARETSKDGQEWLLLVHKIPREPTAGRVYVWRKLKQLGAGGQSALSLVW